MSRKWCQSSSSPFSSLFLCTFIGCLVDDDFYLSVLYLVFYFLFYSYATCVFIHGFGIGGIALLSAVLSFVSCGSGDGIDVITNTFLAQSFLTSILRVGVCVTAYGFVERADRK